MLYQIFIVLSILFHIPLTHAGKSHAEVIFPILAALQSVQQQFLSDKEEHSWHSTNEKQTLFIDTYLQHTKDLAKISPNEFAICASCNKDEINTFLKEHNCTMYVSPFKNSECSIASLMNIGGKWKEKGDADFIACNKEWYHAIVISNKDTYKIIQMYDYNYPIVTLATGHGDTVSITVANKMASGFELLKNIEKIIYGVEAQEITNDYNGVKFPMVDLTHRSNLFWLVGMNKLDKKEKHAVSIAQALQEITFKMNHAGFVANDGTMSSVLVPQGVCAANEEQWLIIDKPFFVWIERKDIRLPLFAGYIDIEDWKKPKR